MANHLARFRQLQQLLQANQAILLSTPTDLRYFASFSVLLPEEREGFFLITSDESYLIKASFSPAPSTADYQILEHCRPTALAQHLTKIIEKHQLQEIRLDYSSLFVEEYQAIQTVAQQKNVSLTGLDREQIWKYRMVKDQEEIEIMRQAGRYAQAAFKAIFDQLQVGMTEKAVALQIEVELLKLGADQTAFPTIVAFGEHGALPHHQPGESTLKKETAVLIDMGAMTQGYRSDLTRSFWFGSQPTPEFQKVEKIIEGAYKLTLQFLEKEIQTKNDHLAAKDLDTVARNYITEQGYENQFIHSTGHGVGLDIHEPPSLNWNNTQLLKTGMIITIEPGIYLPAQFGFRYENTILIKDKEIEVLTL